MKIISLNIWGGHLKRKLLDFVKKHKDVDVLCLQEVYYKAQARITDETRELSLDILSEIHDLLPGFQLFFSPVVNNVYGLATLFRSNIAVKDQGEVEIHHNPTYPGIGPTHSRVLQYVTCTLDDQLVTIANIHGLWNGKGKGDSPERIQQSTNIKSFADSINHSLVLCGDFNLTPTSKSFQILSDNMQNCISRYNITSTRTSYYTKEERYADYMLLSKELQINEFKVLADEVSDHSPLLLDFQVAKDLVL